MKTSAGRQGREPIGHSQGSRYLLGGFCLLLAVLLGLELLFHPHPYFAWDGWFGFNAALGLAAALLLVPVARFLLRPLVKRDEEYYDR